MDTIFVSYNHGSDYEYYERLSDRYGNDYKILQDTSVDREIYSDMAEYVIADVLSGFFTSGTCTLVLVGKETWGDKYVDWEIEASLAAGGGLIGVQLPTLPVINNSVSMPGRLLDNVRSGYAIWRKWDDLINRPDSLETWLHEAARMSGSLIRNGRERRLATAVA